MTGTTAPQLFLSENARTHAVKLHRATCGRLPKGSAPVDKVLGFRPGLVTQASPASCCKPNKDLVAAVKALAAEDGESVAAEESARTRSRHFTPTAPDPEPEAAEEGTTEVSEDGEYSVPVPYHQVGLPKAFWPTMVKASKELVGLEQMTIEGHYDDPTNTVHVTLTGAQHEDDEDYLEDFALYLVDMWRAAGEGLKAHRRQPVYTEDPAPQFRKDREYLAAFVDGVYSRANGEPFPDTEHGALAGFDWFGEYSSALTGTN